MHSLSSLRRLGLGVFFVFCLFLGNSYGQVPADSAVIESGGYTLHKFAQAIGKETYKVRRDGDSLVTTSSFQFTDRGTWRSVDFKPQRAPSQPGRI